MASFPPETTFVWVLASGGCAGGSVCVPLDGLLDPGGSMVVRLPCAAHGEGLSSLDEVIQRSDELVGQIGQLPPSAEIVHTMDEISNTVCSVIDSAELCRDTHSDSCPSTDIGGHALPLSSLQACRPRPPL
uniref:Uncharacterized protein n=1 Tax=Aegilops tauschii subsp. strangulata TaxID=200361 RepID=A0A453I3H4_AEGTS